jgi:hypothetical protein
MKILIYFCRKLGLDSNSGCSEYKSTGLPPQQPTRHEELLVYASDEQPFYTRGTLNIAEESWWHTNPILHIVRGEGDGLWH